MPLVSNSEVELHHRSYIDKNLNEIYLDEIRLSVPLLENAILINSPTITDKGYVTITTKVPGSDFFIQRFVENKDIPPLLQVTEGDNTSNKYGTDLFCAPVSSIRLSRREKFLWDVDTPLDNVNDTNLLRDFIGVLSVFALSKQLKMTDR